MEIKSQYISETTLCKESSRNRSVCHQSKNSAPSVHLLENRPLESGNKCISTKLEESKGTCISPLFPSGSSSKKSPERASKPSSSCIQAWYPCLLHISIKNQNFVAKVAKLFKKYSRRKSLISPKQIYAVGGMDSIYAVGSMAPWCSGYFYSTASFV